MIQEAKQQYRGVLCVHCRQPIPLPATVSRQASEAAEPESGNAEAMGSRVFTLRCRVCHEEGLYSERKIIECEGAPRTRISRSKSGPQLLKSTEKFTRAANG
jgi:cytochrome c5